MCRSLSAAEPDCSFRSWLRTARSAAWACDRTSQHSTRRARPSRSTHRSRERPTGAPGGIGSAQVPPGAVPQEAVRVTEGSLKAHIAQAKSGLPTIGLPGVGSWRLAMPTLESLKARRVRLAFDQDAPVNPNVAGALASACRGLVAAGFLLEVDRKSVV